MKRPIANLLFFASLALATSQALANTCPPGNPPTNCAPPLGAILDLNGQTLPTTYTLYTTQFTATAASTNISFAMRHDPAYFFLDEISVSTGGGANLILNGGFELGPIGANEPTHWTYLNSFGASFAGTVLGGNSGNGSPNSYSDGAVQAYDGITQAISTLIGEVYDISFYLLSTTSGTFSRLSTNGNETGTGGNGIDLLVYAGLVPTLAVPEPATLALLGLGLLGIGFSRRRKS